MNIITEYSFTLEKTFLRIFLDSDTMSAEPGSKEDIGMYEEGIFTPILPCSFSVIF